VHPDDRERALAAWRVCVPAGTAFEVEFRLREGATGRYRWFLSRAIPQHDAAGRVVRWFGTCTDVDARVQDAELAQRLARVTARLAGSLGVDDVARLVVDEGVQALGAQAGSLALLAADGATPELRGVTDASPAEGTREWATFPLADGDRSVGTLGFAVPSGDALTPAQRRFVEQLAQHCAAAIARARLFEELNAARDEAEHANRAKSDFLRVMSHELRSPLTAIDGHAALLEEEIHGPVTAPQREALGRIRRGGRVLLTLINDLLSYARLEAGRMEFSIAPTPLHPLLAQMEGFVAPQMRERELTYRYVPCAPGVRVDADPDKLRQVLLNLLTNASKFTPAGGRVTLGVDRDVSDGWVRIHVADTGVGIDEAKLGSVFEPFVQVDASHTRRREGVGLGLAISRDLARGMEGELSATSSPGLGSVFTVRLRASA
jgi:signal transduction histidine kinase